MLTYEYQTKSLSGLTLDHWKKNWDNTFNGDLYGSKTIKDGTNYTTSRCRISNVVGEFGVKIPTEDGTTYFLGYKRRCTERHSGDSDEQYVMRRTRLRDEAKAQMAVVRTAWAKGNG